MRMTALIESAIVFVIGLVWAIRRRRQASRDVSSILLVLAILVALESAVGLVNVIAGGGATAGAHRWFAHALVVMVWCLTVIAIAAACISIRQRPVTAITSGACVLLVLCLVILESFTGYLGKGARGAVAEETRVRFYVLHALVLPGLAMTTALAGG